MYKAMRACFPKREQVSYEAICESLDRAKKCWGKARSRDRTKQRSEKGREQMVREGKIHAGGTKELYEHVVRELREVVDGFKSINFTLTDEFYYRIIGVIVGSLYTSPQGRIAAISSLKLKDAKDALVNSCVMSTNFKTKVCTYIVSTILNKQPIFFIFSKLCLICSSQKVISL